MNSPETQPIACLLGANDFQERTRWIRARVWSRLPPLVRPWLYFLGRYVLLGGFLDGRSGLTFHFLQALWYQSLIDIKFLNPPPGSGRAAVPGAAPDLAAPGPTPVLAAAGATPAVAPRAARELVKRTQ